MFLRISLLFTLACTLASAGTRSGKAEADWLSQSQHYMPGQPVQTAIRLVIDEHWHTYWSNPGEGGMKISVKWELARGWIAGELEYPVPKRFMTGELAGFGYKGTVIFPVILTPPADFSGEAKLKAKVSWLTCNDDSCIPGDATLELTLAPGETSVTAEAPLIQQALTAIPREREGISMHVVEESKKLKISLKVNSDSTLLPNDCEVFPSTPQAVDPKAEWHFTRDDSGTWNAEVQASEYVSHPLQELSLVLAPRNSHSSVIVHWKAP